jgi:CDP-paratose 2-epimerase
VNDVAHTIPRAGAAAVVITGGCGFIGCNLAHALATRGERVIVLDSLARAGARENAAWLKSQHPNRIEVVVADVRDETALCPVVAEASAVLHLAAQVAVTTSLERPGDDFAVNVRGTLNVLECIRRRNPDAPVIFASTNKVYGKLFDDGDIVRDAGRCAPAEQKFARGVDEDTPLDFYSPYGCSKGAADQYVHDYARVFGLRTAVLRMSCIYGPRQFGTEDQGWIAHFLLRALHGDPITIYGDGRQVRDALFIDDAVGAWLRALDRIDDVKGRIFNLGGGPDNAISLRELVDVIEHMRGDRPSLRYADWRPGDQFWYVSDIAAISRALDWRPQTGLHAGLARLDRWLSERFADTALLRQLEQARA